MVKAFILHLLFGLFFLVNDNSFTSANSSVVFQPQLSFFLAELESSPLTEQKIDGRSDQFTEISK
jgi:hypothetical protein